MTVDRVGAMTVFVKTVESGSLSAAARALGTSLTSVSRQLSALEQSLGALLLVRTTRHLSVTDSGKFYYQHAKRILAEIVETDAALSAREDVPSGELRVSAPTLLGRLKLAPLLPLFLSKYPRLSLDLMLTDRIVHLAEEGADLALRVGRLDDSSLVARKLARIRLVVCAAPVYLAGRGEPRSPHDLKNHDCPVFADGRSAPEWHCQTPSGRKATRVVPRIRANDLDSLVTAARVGLGLVRAPAWQVADHVASGDLRVVLARYERPPTALHALFLRTRLLPLKVGALTDFLVEHWRHNGFGDIPN
jgi:DNA-binding transcriptional LysR family regulator